MSTEEFEKLLRTARVQLVNPYKQHTGGLYVEGITQDQLSEIVTLAGQQLGSIGKDQIVNPKWLELGPEKNIEFMIHRRLLE